MKGEVERMQFFLVIALIFAMGIAVFAIQNPTAILFSFFLWEWRMPLVLVILGSAVLGVIFAMLLGLSKQISRRTEVSKAKQNVKQLERALAQKEDEFKKTKAQLDQLQSQQQDVSGELKTVQLEKMPEVSEEQEKEM